MAKFGHVAALGCAIGLAAGPLAACSNGATGSPGAEGDFDPITMTYSSAFAPGGLNAGMEYLAEEVKERTDDAVKIDFNYSESLVSGFETLKATGDGTVDLGTIPPSYNPSELPLANVLSIPFQTSNPMAQMNAFYEMTTENEALRSEYERAGIHVLMMQPAADGAVGLSEELTDVAQFEGMRLRSIGLLAAALQQLGVEPVAIDPGEIYDGIQRGVIDGYGGFVFDTVHTLGLHEVAPYTYDIGLGQYSVQIIGMNLDLWNSLDPALQEMLTEVSEEFMFEQSAEKLMQFEEEACDAILEGGGSVQILSDNQMASIREQVGDAAVEAWLELVGDAGVDEGEATAFREEFLDRLAEKENEDYGYESGMKLCAER
jgi:TRAP-type C4-dicarboxylate transport system substrate-binding protein